MEWTTEKPTKSGYYWACEAGFPADDSELIRLNWWHTRQDPSHHWVAYIVDESDYWELDNFTHFMGPLGKPEPPKA